ncbi:hypothetical protein KPL71_013709 [Citrus sinensis]|uniref:Uncharacterized protein n=1 Tax=Citrus sinensis TaxID=2711 RepID=A0ACB8LMA1_CITSI|nr:hypothetical protein KPL71_013709 [Citrus sinensis]
MAKQSSYAELLLKLINSIFIIISLTTLLYGFFCLFRWKQSLTKPHLWKPKYEIPARVLLAFNASKWLSDKLPSAWYIYLILAMGALLFLISCLGYVGIVARSPCCLCFDFPSDRTGNLHSTYQFLDRNWRFVRWIALATLTLEIGLDSVYELLLPANETECKASCFLDGNCVVVVLQDAILKKPCGGSFSTVYTGVLASGDKTNIGVKKLDKVVQVVETSDLGLAKLLMINQTQTLTGMRETKGYLPPEWFRNMPVTVKDVIAKGYWKSWCRMMKRQGSDPKTLEKPVMIAIQFVKEKPPLRPSLRIVALMLQSILEVPSPPCSFAFAVRCFKSYPFSVTLDQNWQFCYITGLCV